MSDNRLSSELADVLANLDFATDAGRTIVNINRQLSRPIYEEFKKILKALGGTWNKKVHVFPDDPRERIAVILETGIIPDANPLDYFPTPASIVEEIFSLNEVKDIISLQEFRKIKVLEPSCGTGAFLRKLLALSVSPSQITGVELNPINVMACKRISPELNIVLADFMKWEAPCNYDLIIMNPPFQRNLWQKHLEKAITLLAPMGIIVCITPRNLPTPILRKICTNGCVLTNPEKSFKESGTLVDTCIIVFKNDPHPRTRTHGWPSWDAWQICLIIDNDCDYNTRIEHTVRAHNTDEAQFTKLLDEINDDALKKYQTGMNLLDEDYKALYKYYRRSFADEEAGNVPETPENSNEIKIPHAPGNNKPAEQLAFAF